MITKDRLEELIEQGAKIYGIGKQNNIFEFGLKLKKNAMYLLNQENFKKTDWYKKKLETYSTFFETKVEAEEYLEFGNIVREERLELPSWEEFDKVGNYFFVGKTYTFYNLNKRRKKLYLRFSFDDDYWQDDKEWELTKENYNEERRLCKKLFLGEEI